MTQTAVRVLANTFLKRAFQEKIAVSPMKLQQFLYLAYREYGQKGPSDSRLFSERFEAWPYGPVVPGVYLHFKACGAGPINHFVRNADGSVCVLNEAACPLAAACVETVWQRFKTIDEAAISARLRAPGSAWRQAREAGSVWLRDGEIEHDESE